MHGGALRFNGATHAITIADDSRLRIDTATFAVWVRIDQLPSGGDLATIAGKTFGAGESNTWELFLDDNAAVDLAAGGDAGTTTYAQTPWTPACARTLTTRKTRGSCSCTAARRRDFSWAAHRARRSSTRASIGP